MEVIKIPNELATQASKIPGLSDKVARFIQMEIIQYEQRMQRFHTETIDLVARAKINAESQRASGCNVDDVKKSFERHLEQLTESDPPC